jgi:N-acetylmuramoyl-L-alanine amidase
LSHRPFSIFPHILSAAVAVALLLVAVRLAGQGPGSPLTLVARESRRTMPVSVVGNQEFVALDDLAAAFQLAVREEAGAITVSYRGRTVVLTADQALASVAGRLVSLPAAPTRVSGRWLVPLEFISRALAPVYDARLDLRRGSRLVVIGDLRVPRVTIRQETLPDATRLTVEASPPSASSITQETGRLAIRFDADALDVAIPAFQPQSLLQAIRTSDPVTLAVELGPRFGSFRASTQTLPNASRLVLDLLGVATETAAPPPAPAPTPPPAELPVFGSPASAIRTIAIDPGHGGNDEGARGAEGTLEKDLTLAVARRLKATVEGRLGIRVLLTRDDDRNVPMDGRTAVANNNKADLFISLHANASVRASATGASVHVAAFDHAQARTAPAPEHVPVFGGGSRDIELVLWDLAQIRYLDRSAEFARTLEEQLVERVPLDARPLDRAPFRVLESANMPAVLIEMGYLTNPDQEKLLAGGAFQTTFVQAVFDSIVRFRDYLASSNGGER